MPPAAPVRDEVALLRECLATITDPRHARGIRHPLLAVLSLTVLALMAGQSSLSAIWRWGGLSFPGMEQVGEVKKRVRFLKRGEEKETTHYFVTSLSPQQAGPAPLLGVFRGHWGIENSGFHVTDDSFGEDRHVLCSHRGAAVMSLLRQAALNLLRGRCEPWPPAEPLTGRAQRVCARPLALLPVAPGP